MEQFKTRVSNEIKSEEIGKIKNVKNELPGAIKQVEIEGGVNLNQPLSNLIKGASLLEMANPAMKALGVYSLSEIIAPGMLKGFFKGSSLGRGGWRFWSRNDGRFYFSRNI
jgi:hypothetical protein